MQIIRVSITKLFGYLNHDIHFVEDKATIVTAPNGAGKTTVLRLIKSVMQLDILEISKHQFEELSLCIDNWGTVHVRKSGGADEPTEIFTSVLDEHDKSLGVASFSHEEVNSVSARVPPYYDYMGQGRWMDRRTMETVPDHLVRRRPGMRRAGRDAWTSKKFDPMAREKLDLLFRGNVILVDTHRLDQIDDEDPRSYASKRRDFGGDSNSSRISSYLKKIRNQIVKAKSESVRQSQLADATFVERAIQQATSEVDAKELRIKYDSMLEKNNQLAINGLAAGDPVPFPSEADPVILKIMRPFIEDWSHRLEPLLDVNAKLELLRNLLDEKLSTSLKKTAMSSAGGVKFKGWDGGDVNVASLSSGEQHLVALYTQLIFDSSAGDLVLIDEPEISWHVAWQETFLDDLERIRKLTQIQVIVATHSVSIINDKWNQTRDLYFPPAPASVSRSDFIYTLDANEEAEELDDDTEF